MSATDVTQANSRPGRFSSPASTATSSAPVVLEAVGLSKSFRIPEHRVDSFKERAVHPLRRASYRELGALQDVSFEVRKGEFFGIVGRNGSGKSTLLKVLASIYRADAGTVRIAGRLAPFIELGVGFNPDLSARENVVLNGVMMGLTPREARLRLDSVFDFAELDDFREMKLKNFSSGMVVRLAFSVMLEADSDILLVDEVLAVGDASFQRKCQDSFHEMRDEGKTVVLVTHDMNAVDTYCDRAMLLRGGVLDHIGDPGEVARRYFRYNFEEGDKLQTEDGIASLDLHADMVGGGLERVDGSELDENELEIGEPIRFSVTLEARRDLVEPSFRFDCTGEHGAHAFATRFEQYEGAVPDVLSEGERLTLRGSMSNPLNPGAYKLIGWIRRRGESGELVLQAVEVASFTILPPDDLEHLGLVTVDAEIEVETDVEAEPEVATEVVEEL